MTEALPLPGDVARLVAAMEVNAMTVTDEVHSKGDRLT